MTNFQSLNDWVSGLPVEKPFVRDVELVAKASEQALAVVKSLPSDYASEYAVVQVMEYNTSGAATDVTNSKGNISVPNSVVSSAQSRLNELKVLQDEHSRLLPPIGTYVAMKPNSVHVMHLGEIALDVQYTYGTVSFRFRSIGDNQVVILCNPGREIAAIDSNAVIACANASEQSYKIWHADAVEFDGNYNGTPVHGKAVMLSTVA